MEDEEFASNDCPGCGGGDKVPAGADYWCCPVCDTEWHGDGEGVMSGIVEQLLAGIDSYTDTGLVATQAGLIRQAAAEITRLREQIAAADELAVRKDEILGRIVSWDGDDVSAFMPMAKALSSESTSRAEEIAHAIRAAVLVEREACAQVALLKGRVDWEDGDGGPYGEGYEMACEEVYYAILARAASSSPTPPNTQPACANGGESKPEDAR